MSSFFSSVLLHHEGHRFEELSRFHQSSKALVLNILRLKGLLRLEPEDVESLLILSADGEVTAITREAFRGDMDPSGLPEVFSLKGCDIDLVCSFMSCSLRAPVVAEQGRLRLFKALSLSPCVMPF